ncbi:MAG: hypothetical protein AAFY88_20090, partial [Acidobacteriota bacterium]
EVPAARSTPVPLWLRSGVVGCDDLLQILAEFEYQDFPAATAALDGRTFTAELRYASTGAVIASADVPLQAFAPGSDGVLYFSDASGCPRSVFENSENVYISGYTTAIENGVALFLVDPDNATTASQQIVEQRPQYQASPQLVSGVGQGAWTHLLWHGTLTTEGDYGAVVGTAKNRTDFVLKVDDKGVGALDGPLADGKHVHGMTIQEDECPDCDPFWPGH